MKKLKAILLALIAGIFFCLGSFLIEDQVATAGDQSFCSDSNNTCYIANGNTYYGDRQEGPPPPDK